MDLFFVSFNTEKLFCDGEGAAAFLPMVRISCQEMSWQPGQYKSGGVLVNRSQNEPYVIFFSAHRPSPLEAESHAYLAKGERSHPVMGSKGFGQFSLRRPVPSMGVVGETMKAKGLNFLSRDDLAAEAVLVSSVGGVVVDRGQNDCNIVFLSAHHPLEAGGTRILGEGRKKVLVP